MNYASSYQNVTWITRVISTSIGINGLRVAHQPSLNCISEHGDLSFLLFFFFETALGREHLNQFMTFKFHSIHIYCLWTITLGYNRWLVKMGSEFPHKLWPPPLSTKILSLTTLFRRKRANNHIWSENRPNYCTTVPQATRSTKI